MCGPPVKQERFPHSETAGSKVDGTSPTSIAAVCVFPRSKSPRHPLLALVVNLFILRLASELRRLKSRITPMEWNNAGYSLHFLKNYWLHERWFCKAESVAFTIASCQSLK